MSKINIENRKKVNNIYNQCVIYSLILGALSVPFLIPGKAKSPKNIINHSIEGNLPAQTAPVMPKPVFTAHSEARIAHGIASGQALIQALAPKKVASGQALSLTKVSMWHAHAIVQPKIIIPVETKAAVPIAVKPSLKSSDKITIQTTKIDRDFLHKMEGSILKGYVPLPGKTKSGATIASGLDLGQLSVQAFNQLPINDALKARLRPYVGKKKYEAVAFLKAHPLTITPAEMQELNNVAANMILQPLAKSYDKASKTPFKDLPSAAQTALFSFAYQYGAGFMYKSGTPHQLWNYYVEQNWSKVSQTLRSFKVYAPRRHQEAKLINNLVFNN